MIKQILEVTRMNILSIPSRWSSSIVIVVGIAGVVGVLVSILSMSSGMSSVFNRSTEDDRAIIVRTGAEAELSSNLSINDANIVGTVEGLSIVAPELYLTADIPKKATGTPSNLAVRGVTEASFEIRPELTIIEGRMFNPGVNEITVGTRAQQEFEGLEIGDQINIREFVWTVVGVFECDGAAVESEIWTDLTNSQSAFRFEGGVSVVRVQLEDPELFDEIDEAIESDPRMQVNMVSEKEWYEREATAGTQIIQIFGTIVAVIMSIGAVFAALNTMYAAVASRTFEIATLRAMGFGGGSVVVSVMVESLLLALIGGLIGAAVAFVAFNQYTVSTLHSSTFTQVAFEFMVTSELVILGVIVSLVLGMIGGLFPAIRAALMPVTRGLRGE